jgi:hypothetical protein
MSEMAIPLSFTWRFSLAYLRMIVVRILAHNVLRHVLNGIACLFLGWVVSLAAMLISRSEHHVYSLEAVATFYVH